MEKWPEEYPDPNDKKEKEQTQFNQDDLKAGKESPLISTKVVIGCLLGLLFVTVGIAIGVFLSLITVTRSEIQALPPAQVTPIAITDLPQPTPTETPLPPPTTTFPTQTPAAPFPGMVFSNPEGLWLANGNWEPEKISPNPDSRLSPNGRYLTFMGDGDLFLLNRETKETKNLTANIDQSFCCPQWWPGRSDTIIIRPWSSYQGQPITGLATVTIDGNYQLIEEIGAIYDAPAPSPDGTTIAFSQAGQPALYHDRQDTALLDLESFGLPPFPLVSFPAWSQDGNYLAWIATDNPTGGIGQMSIIILDLAAQTGRVVHSFTGALDAYDWQNIPESPAWSWDGKWVAFHAQGSIWVVSADGQEKLHLGDGSAPKWIPEIHDRVNLEVAVNKVEGPTLIYGKSGSGIALIAPKNGRLVEWRPSGE